MGEIKVGDTVRIIGKNRKLTIDSPLACDSCIKRNKGHCCKYSIGKVTRAYLVRELSPEYRHNERGEFLYKVTIAKRIKNDSCWYWRDDIVLIENERRKDDKV